MADVNGQAGAWTVLTPIIAGHEQELRAHLDGLPQGEASPLAAATRTHFARWVMIPQLVHQGRPQEPDALKSQYLLFTACVDGPRETYPEHLCAAMGEAADAIWGHCVGYPGASDAERFRAWFEHNHLPSTFFVAAYPETTVEQVRAALALRERLIALAVQAQGLDAAGFAKVYREAFGDRGATVGA